MRSVLLLLLIVSMMTFSAVADTTGTAVPLAKQMIAYRTSKATEMYLVWAMDNWKVPLKQFQPAGTYEKEGMAYTPMLRTADGFKAELSLPAGTYIDFMFQATKDSNGAATDSWDMNWSSKYNFLVDGKQPLKIFHDEKLYIVPAAAEPFNIVLRGFTIFLVGGILLLTAVSSVILLRRSSWRSLSAGHLVAGVAVSTFLVMIIVRMQMNGLLGTNRFLVFGSVLQDLVYLLALGGVVALPIMLTRRWKIVHAIFCSFAVMMFSASLIATLLNIQIVHELGKPLTYGWLYYSDFLQSNDAKASLTKGLGGGVLRNLFLILGGVLTGGLAISLVAAILPRKVKLSLGGLTIGCFLVVGISQKGSAAYNESRLSNPVTVFLSSWLRSEARPPLFSIVVSRQVKDQIVAMHEGTSAAVSVPDTGIRHVVLFVMESTPANLVQVYDSTYKVTPHLARWSKDARIYTSMYAHLPSTVNSLFSMLSGMYPMISYRSVVKEFPEFNAPALSEELQSAGWATSIFFSSDLGYSNIDAYLKNQHIGTSEDCKSIACEYQPFDADYAASSGLDDRCIVDRYLKWADSLGDKRTLSLLWTNQTHYPYFISGEAEQYSKDKSLNTYLNALRADDDAFGRLMEGLQKRRVLGSSLILVVGDHGEAFGTHGQYTHGGFIFEENVHVPCMLIRPGQFHGEQDDRVAGLIDIAPTIISLAGIAKPGSWQGSSLLNSRSRSHTFMLGPYADFQFASRFEQWKLIYNGATGESKLFDLRNDPRELRDVSSSNPNLVKREIEVLAAWVQYHTAKMSQFLPIRQLSSE